MQAYIYVNDTYIYGTSSPRAIRYPSVIQSSFLRRRIWISSLSSVNTLFVHRSRRHRRGIQVKSSFLPIFIHPTLICHLQHYKHDSSFITFIIHHKLTQPSSPSLPLLLFFLHYKTLPAVPSIRPSTMMRCTSILTPTHRHTNDVLMLTLESTGTYKQHIFTLNVHWMNISCG